MHFSLTHNSKELSLPFYRLFICHRINIAWIIRNKRDINIESIIELISLRFVDSIVCTKGKKKFEASCKPM